jgi:prolipoprotein diacylglyceryl transferase
MHPVLFEIGGVRVYSHGFFFAAGLFVCLFVVAYEARRRRWPPDEAIPITLSAFVGGVLGARLAMLLFAGWDAAPVVLDYFSLFDPSVGPGSILGGMIGAYTGGYLASRALETRCTCDAFAPAMALGLAVGRIGDYLSAEDGLGKATTLPWGVPVPGVDYLVHPAPLYDAGFNVLWFCALVALRDRLPLRDGDLLKIGFAGYALFRFFVEFVRNNAVLAFGLTGQQLVCVALVAVTVLYYGSRQRPALASSA